MIYSTKHLIFLAVPEGTPSNFKANDITSTAATLSWDPPPFDSQNGVIIQYIINVTVQETGERFQLTSVTNSLIATGLSPFRTYVCIIAAATSVGLGPFGDMFSVMTLEDGKNILIFYRTKTNTHL